MDVERMHRRVAKRVVVAAIVAAPLATALTQTADATQPVDAAPSIAWRGAAGFVHVEAAVSTWLAESPSEADPIATWRRAVEEAECPARLAAPLRRVAAEADERFASVASESPPEPPPWFETIGAAEGSLRLAIAEQLAGEQRHEACLAWTDGVSPDDVFSPALLHYLRAVAARLTIDDERSAVELERLEAHLEANPGDDLGPARDWVAAALRREVDRKSDGLPLLARRMREVDRRLDRAASGDPTQSRQQKILDELDDMIAKLEEQQKQQQQQAASGGGGGGSPSEAAEESRPGELKGPGEVDRRRLVAGDAWGALPPAERERLTQEITRGYPDRFRTLIEDYFRTLASESEAGAEPAVRGDAIEDQQPGR